MKRYKKIIAASLLATVMATGCKKLDLAPSDRFSELTFWTVNENVYNALNNNYSLMYNSGLYLFLDATSDNAVANVGNTDLIATGNFNPDLPRFLGDWGYYYSTIKSCNQFLTYVDRNQTLPAATITRLKAETRFIRAFEHFNLAKWYGDVPLLDRDITPDESKTVARSPKAAVIQFVLNELDAAAAVLPAKEQLTATENGRITKGAALALKARVLLYEGNRMQDVVNVCEQLMNNQGTNGAYSLHPSYPALFNDPVANKTNNEVILDLVYVPVERTWSDFFDLGPRSIGSRSNAMAPTQELVDSYIMLNGKAINETGSSYNEATPYTNRDPRLTATVVYDRYNWTSPTGPNKIIYIRPGSDPNQPGLDEYSPNGQGSPTGYYWRKHFDPSAIAPFKSGSNLHLIRYAEILLTYAEAKESLGQMDASVWDKTIGALRRRAGFTDAGALTYSSTNIRNVIRNERRSEFAFEGLRTDDIRRWRIAETVLNTTPHGAKFGDPAVDNGYIRLQRRQFDPSKHYLWPIPSAERALNPNLSQNPGY